ncbi:MAG: MoaD/ThiS family protein [Verrucomicrobiae bacterium]|nr:MoaD/ThiS family protein [Verrucomicrobiae bacterium]
MPQVTFSYTGQLANAAGTPEETLDLAEGALLRAALDDLASRYDGRWREMIFDDGGNVRSTVLIVLDGEQATGDKNAISLDGVRTVMLMTPIAGG